MAIDGKWEITINSPMGAQKATLELKTEGGALTGTQTAMQGTQPVTNGKVDGNSLSWSANDHLAHAHDPGIHRQRWMATSCRAASRPAPSAPFPSAAAAPPSRETCFMKGAAPSRPLLF